MATDDKMDLSERRKCLRLAQESYLTADRAGCSVLLDMMEVVTGLDRKSLIRLMASDLERRPRQRQRGKHYGLELDRALRVIAESYDYICAERLTPNLLAMAEHLAQHRELELTEPLRQQLASVSEATVYRRLARLRQDGPRRARRPPRATSAMVRAIPMRMIAWDERQPGHFEVDLVHHSGPSAEGEYVCTLQMIDVATGWSERVAVLGRSYLVMADGFRRCQTRLPFGVLELHSDNGSEFLNDLMLDFWKKQPQSPAHSRSRPYKKNDNRFVEQKNYSEVRAYFGYARLETVVQTNRLNQLYDRLWLYTNFFQPVLRLAEKTITRSGETTHIKRRFDQARTPFERLCATGVLELARQQALEQFRQRTNPRRLRQEIYALIDELFAQPCARPGRTEPVRQSLLPAGRWMELPCWTPAASSPAEQAAPSQTPRRRSAKPQARPRPAA
jgi:hypothetical protein